jgi:hypothetical protein
MDMRTVLEKISALSSPTIGMAGGSHAPVEEEMSRCAACGEKTHVDASTGFCIDCLDQMAKDQGKQDHRAFTDAPEENVNEDRMCETCGQPMESCECEELEEVAPEGWEKTVKGMKKHEEIDNPWALANWMKGQGYKGHEEEEVEEQQLGEATCPQCHKDPCVCKSETNEDQLQLEAIRRLAECGDMWAAAPQQASGMNVTTNVDSKTGNKSVTVTADGAGAEELMQILAMAGVAVAPMAAPQVAMAEELANSPNPDTVDAETQLVGMSGGPNAPHGQYNPDRGRDNSMSMVDEAVERLAENLAAKFRSGK